MPQQQSRALAHVIAKDLEQEDFEVSNHHENRDDDHGSVTFLVNCLTGVNIRWLSHFCEERGWHIEKVENTGATVITLESGVDSSWE